MSIETLKAQLTTDLKDDQDLLRACSAIVTNLVAADANLTKHITFAALSRLAGLSEAADSIPAATYLSGSRINFLRKSFMLILDDEEFEFTADEIYEAKASKKLYHPNTGEIVSDFEKHLYLFFCVSASATKIIKEST